MSETAILIAGDLHYGKRTATYNPGVFVQRMDRLGEKLLAIKDLHGQALEGLTVAFMGDLNDGTDIYKTQAHHQAITNVERQAWELADYLTPWLRYLDRKWGGVRVEGVLGNHGRGGNFAHEAASWDMVTYRYLELGLAHDGIEVQYPHDDNPFLRKFTVRGHQYLQCHGNSIRCYQNIPWYGIQNKIFRWKGTSLAPFDVAMFGHFHTAGNHTLNNTEVFLTGTLVDGDMWALEQLGYESESLWWLVGVSDKRPITWGYKLNLD